MTDTNPILNSPYAEPRWHYATVLFPSKEEAGMEQQLKTKKKTHQIRRTG